MQVNLELYPFDMDRDPFANIVCNVVPRVGEHIRISERDNPANGSYRVLLIEHILSPGRTDTLQHVCVVVLPERAKQ